MTRTTILRMSLEGPDPWELGWKLAEAALAGLGAPTRVYVNGKRVRGKDSTAKGESKGTEDLHLITWDIPTGRYTDHGAIFYENGGRPSYVNSIAVGRDGVRALIVGE